MSNYQLGKSIEILNALPWFKDMYFATKALAEASAVKHISKIFYVADQSSPWSVYDGDGNVVPFTGNVSAIQAQVTALAGADVKSITFDDGTRTLTVTLNDDSTKEVVIPGGETTGTLTKDITAAGVSSVLGIADGTVFATGLEFTTWLEAFVRRIVHPTYATPTASLSSSLSTVEVGTVLTPALTATFNQNDGGAVNNVTFDRGGTELQTGLSTTHTDDDGVAIGEETVTYGVQVDYDAGAIKQNNIGEDDAVGQIAAGSVSASRNVTGKYRLFALTAAATPGAVDSDYIRTNNAIGTKYKGTGSYVLDVAGSKYVAIVCPPGVTLDTANTKNPDTNEKVFDGITATTIEVSCAGAATATYNIYVLETASAWGDGAVFNVELN